MAETLDLSYLKADIRNEFQNGIPRRDVASTMENLLLQSRTLDKFADGG